MKSILLVLFVSGISPAFAQDLSQSFPDSSLLKTIADKPHVFRTKSSYLIPTVLFVYGFSALEIHTLKIIDNGVENEIREDHPLFKTDLDNYLQYAPSFLVFGLNAAGIKGKNNFRDRTLIFLLSNAIMAAAVNPLKDITRSVRPDGFGTNAFPSGHTATAFVGAEFLRREYKDVSPWYGIAGYTMATATGILRMYNNRHWLRDIAAGAGIGILSTELAYQLEPVIARKIFHKKNKAGATGY